MRLNFWLTGLFQCLSKSRRKMVARRPKARCATSASVTERLESRQLLSAAALQTPANGISPQLLPDNPPTIVNTTTTGDQTGPAIATDAAGDYVVVWISNVNQNQTGASSGIFGQRYAANGTPEGSQFEVINFPANASPTNTNITSVSVAMDAKGDFVVAWSQTRLVVSSSASNQVSPAFAINAPDGDYAQRFNSSGVAQGAVFTLGSSLATLPAVAMDSAGDFVIAWLDTINLGNSQAIESQRYSAAGIAQGNSVQDNQNSAIIVQGGPSVAMDKSGDFVVTWTGTPNGASVGFPPSDIYGRTFNAAGITQGNDLNLNVGLLYTNTKSKVSMDAAGDFVVTWLQDTDLPLTFGGTTNVVAQRFNANGTNVGNAIVVASAIGNSSQTVSNPSVASDAAGDFVVTWTSMTAGVQNIFAQVYFSNGARDQGQLTVSSGPVLNEDFSVVAMDAQGDFEVAWQGQNQTSNSFDIYKQQYSVGPTVSSVQLNSGPQVIHSGDTLIAPVSQLTVVFSSNLVTVPGSVHSVTNLTNWKLFRYGVDYSSLITGVTFSLNPTTEQYTAVVTFSRSLVDGGYQLVVLARVQDFSGRPLNGAGNGIQGSDYALNFFVAQTLPVGPETKVNTYTTAGQTNPVTAMDAAGDYVIVWTSVGDGSLTGIYAQRYNAAGVPLGAQFQVNTFTAGAEDQPSVAMDAAGDFVITWTKANVFSQANNFSTIEGQRYNSHGVAVGGEFTVDTNTTGAADLNSSVAMDAAGDFVVTWTRQHAAGPPVNIFAQRFNSAGVKQSAEFQVSKETGQQDSSSIAMDATGDFVVAWTNTSSAGLSIDAQRFSAAGTALGSLLTVGTNDANLAHVAMDATGDFVVTWFGYQNSASGFDVFAQRYNAQGTAEGGNVVVNTFTSRFQENPSIAMDAAGDYVISWQSYAQDGSNWGVYAQRFNAAGFAEGSEFKVNTYTRNAQNDPAVAIDAKGDFLIAWESFGQDGNGYGIYAQRFTTEIAPLLSQGPLTVQTLEPSQSTVVDPTIQIFDHLSDELVSASIQITGNYQRGQDQLLFVNTPTITGTWDATTGTLKLTGVDTIANYRAALQSIMILTNGTNTSPRTITFAVADGLMLSNRLSEQLEFGIQPF